MSQKTTDCLELVHPILVMGDSQAGKTTFQGAMMCPRQLTIRGQSVARPRLYTQTSATHAYLMDAYARLAAGEFPAATHAFTDLAVRVQIPPAASAPGRAFELRFLDFDGELHTTRLDVDNEMHKRLIEAVLESRGIVYLFDLAAYFAVAPTEAARRGVALRANIDTFAREARKRGIARPDGRLPIRVALTLTKAERYLSSPDELRLAKRLFLSEDGCASPHTEARADCMYRMDYEPSECDARDLKAVECVLASYEPHGANLLDTLREFFEDVSVHLVSAVGMVREQELWRPNITLQPVRSEDGNEILVERVRAVNHIRPIGLFDPIVHLLDGAESTIALGEPAPRPIHGAREPGVWTSIEEEIMSPPPSPPEPEPEPFIDLPEIEVQPRWLRNVKIASVVLSSALAFTLVVFFTHLVR